MKTYMGTISPKIVAYIMRNNDPRLLPKGTRVESINGADDEELLPNGVKGIIIAGIHKDDPYYCLLPPLEPKYADKVTGSYIIQFENLQFHTIAHDQRIKEIK